MLLSAGACKKPQAQPDAGPRALPPPTAPANLLVTAHFGHPTSSVRALSTLAGMNVPFELGMSMVLGFDSTLLAAVDLSKPVDMVITGTPEERDVTVAFFPQAPASLRSTLSTRFRFTTVEGVGDRLDLRTQGREQAWRCAIVGAPGEISSRVVCSTREQSLATSARWVALVSSQRATETDDGVFEVDGGSARSSMAPYFRRVLEQGSAMLGASAQQAREQHTTAPDLGDPEPLITRARQLSTQVDAMFVDLRRVVVKLTVESNALVVDATGELNATGSSTIAQGTTRAMAMPTTHALTGRLAPDAPIAAGWRTPADSLRAHMQTLVRTAFDVLGSRVPNAESAQPEMDALFAHVGDEVAVAFSRAPVPPARPARPGQPAAEPALGAWEFTALASQDDQGAAVTALLPQLARAPWLRGMRIGTVAPTITTARNALFVRLPPRPEPIAQPGLNERATPSRTTTTSDVGLAVSNGQLAVLFSPNARDLLRRLDARTAGPAPNVLGAASEGPMVVGVDARALRGEAPPALVRLSWGGSREGDVLSSRFRISLSDQVLRMLRRARREE